MSQADGSIRIAEEPFTALAELARVPIAFTVDRIAVAHGAGAGGFSLTERREDRPWIKDYDALAGQGPLSWPARFDLSRWKLLLARRERRCIGGATLALKTPGLEMLEGRDDVAVLWDIRVEPESRHGGVGTALFAAAEQLAIDSGARLLRIETQDINWPGCRFYGRMGCELRSANRFAYPQFPGETQLIWEKELGAPSR
ncbi:MAG TPA: GNAT family N-acetyltransferase [Gemmatimonadales bacterium]|nr:GNAT family N-acetyltransferase [Gemmatimonadales bacterium]